MALALCGVAFLAARPACAALGALGASPAAETTTLTYDAYTVRQTILSSGGVVREFLDPSGRIFAVAWRTPVAPDLRQLLGEHFDAYARGLRQLEKPGRQRSVRVLAGDLIFEASARPRAYEGHAYPASALPPGTSGAQLR